MCYFWHNLIGMMRVLLKSLLRLIFPLLLACPLPFLLMNCARESAPTGGPIDKDAPYAVFEKPANNSQNISPQKIVIKFNEFIALDNIEDNCMISPIMEKKPEFSVKKKKLTISLPKQTLQPNTTYSFNFNNAIKDLTENNFTEQYLYAFSTGTGIDTMKIAGKISSAKDGKVPEHVYVLLYDDLSDTAFQTQKPRYITQAAKKGDFSFSNIEAKPYKIYALEDSDKDFTFNQPKERIAFLDTIFNPTAERFIDTVWFTHNDTVRFKEFKDSIQLVEVKDSFNLVEKTRWSDQDVQLSLFENEVWNQEVLSNIRISPYAIGIKMSAKNNMPTLKNVYPQGESILEEVSQDSLVIWLLDTLVQNSDSTVLSLSYKKNIQSSEVKTDTIQIESSKSHPERVTISTSIDKTKKIFPDDTLFVTLSRPIKTDDFQKITLYQICDTTKNSCEEINAISDYKYRPTLHYQTQKILRYKEANDRFAIYFSKAIKPQDVKVTLDGLPNLSDWYYCELDEKSNALLYWIKPNSDALRLKNQAITVTYPMNDGATETKNFNNKKDVAVQKMYKHPSSNKRLILQVSEVQKKTLKPYEPIRIYCNNPVHTITDSLFTLINDDDSLETSIITKIALAEGSSRIINIYHTAEKSQNYTLTIQKSAIVDTFGFASREFIETFQTENTPYGFYQKVPFAIQKMPSKERSYAITADWTPNTEYTLIVLDTTFVDVFGDANDSIQIRFQSPKKENLGNLNIKNTQGLPAGNIVFVLTSDDPKDPTTYSTTSSNTIQFNNIPAGKYSLSCFVDENNNQTWDSGCLELKRQPEKMFFFKESVIIKAEWDNSIYWEEFK